MGNLGHLEPRKTPISAKEVHPTGSLPTGRQLQGVLCIPLVTQPWTPRAPKDSNQRQGSSSHRFAPIGSTATDAWNGQVLGALPKPDWGFRSARLRHDSGQPPPYKALIVVTMLV